MSVRTPKTPKTPKTPSKPTHQVEWKHCSQCQAQFNLKDKIKHEEMCPVILSSLFQSVNNHGFILSEHLYGVVEHSNCKACLEYLPAFEKKHLILISPSAMHLCNIEIGSEILAETTSDDKRCCILIAWPCSHIHPTSVGISIDSSKLLQTQEKDILKISRINDQRTVASDVYLKSLTENFIPNSKKLAEAVLFQHERRTICRGVCLGVNYYGQKWQLIIDNVVSISETLLTTEISNIEHGVELLSLAENFKAKEYCYILPQTKFHFTDQCIDEVPNQISKHYQLSGFGGNSRVVEEIKKMCCAIFLSPSKRVSSPRGILIYGTPGTGKTFLAHAIANHFQVGIIIIHGPELFSKYYGETEERLRGKFELAKKSEPCIIFIDEIDSLCPRRDSTSTSHSDQERRVVATLLSILDSISDNSKIVIIGATNRPDALDSALRRPGRLDREYELKVPTVYERQDIVKKLLSNIPHVLNEEDMRQLAMVTHGFVGADLSLLCEEASLSAAKRIISLNPDLTDEKIAAVASISKDDFKCALHIVKPSAMREVLIETPNVRLADIGGYEELKLKLKQAVSWPLQFPEKFKQLGVEPPRGLLMFGPPGCSKTMIAKALATESGLNFIAVKGPELFSKWVGESERGVREVFRRARQVAPAIIFLDELDALGSARGGSSSASVSDRVLAQLLTEMDGIEVLKDVIVIAATNRPDMIDKALLRPGRLDRIVYVSLPDSKTRREILEIKFRKMPIGNDVSLEWLVGKTEGYSGAEVTAVCNEAGLRALEENMGISHIEKRHFDFALTTVAPRITADIIAFYEKYLRESGIHAL